LSYIAWSFARPHLTIPGNAIVVLLPRLWTPKAVIPKGCGNATLGDPMDAGMRAILFLVVSQPFVAKPG
jgi:hypothetical protein